MNCNHHHSPSEIHLEDADKEKKSFYGALSIASLFLLIELIGGIIAKSLALISDALHLFTDVGALMLGLFVIAIYKRPASWKKSYGYERAEVLGALFSGITLWVLVFFLIYEAIQRLIHPSPVHGPIVFFIALAGLVANLCMMKLLHPGEKGSMNLRAAYLHVLGDLISSLGVIIGGIVIWLTGYYIVDSLVTFLLSVLILVSSGKMILEAVNILMEGAPRNIEPEKVYNDLKNLEGVSEIHDLHIWSLSSKKKALSVHIVASPSAKKVLKEAHTLLKKKYGIQHMTIQVEDPEHFEKEYCYDCNGKYKN
jgi:cobalt-zinc-cadmium efflux system protein